MIIEECAALGITKDKLYTKMSRLGYPGAADGLYLPGPDPAR